MINDRVRKFLEDQRGAEVSELAVVLSLIVAGSIALIVLIGGKVTNNFTSFNNKLP